MPGLQRVAKRLVEKDTTDFRVAEAETDPDCLFCSAGFQGRAVAKNRLAYAVRHDRPVTEGHTLVIPFRHTPDFFSDDRQ